MHDYNWNIFGTSGDIYMNLPMPTSRSTLTKQLLFWEDFHSHWNNRKTCYFIGWHSLWPALTLSVDDCLQGTGMLEPGILPSRVVAHFSLGYCPEPVQTLSCAFHCMSLLTFSPSECDVKRIRCLYQGHTLVKPIPSCFCHIWKHHWVVWNQCQNWPKPFTPCRPCV